MKIEKITPKLIAFGVVVSLAFVLGGCKNSDLSEGSNSNSKEKKVTVEKKSRLFGGGAVSLKDALTKGKAVKCVSEDAGGKWTVFTNGKNFKTEGVDSTGKEMAVVSNEKVTYIWEKKTKEGYKIDMDCLADLQKSMGINLDMDEVMSEVDDFSPEEMTQKEESGNLNCVSAGKIDFSVPTDVKFVDQCKLMKEQMEQVKSSLPEGVGLPRVMPKFTK